jgi:hypothetical protein
MNFLCKPLLASEEAEEAGNTALGGRQIDPLDEWLELSFASAGAIKQIATPLALAYLWPLLLVLAERLDHNGLGWFASERREVRKSSCHLSKSRAQGIHERLVLFILEERAELFKDQPLAKLLNGSSGADRIKSSDCRDDKFVVTLVPQAFLRGGREIAEGDRDLDGGICVAVVKVFFYQ